MHFLKKNIKFFALIIATALLLTSIFKHLIHNNSQGNLYSVQSEAFINKRLDISKQYYDSAEYQGHYYVPFPPFPSVLLLPFVYLFGKDHTNVVIISTLLTICNLCILLSIFKKLDLNRNNSIWLIMAFLMGTAYWIALKLSGGVWYFSHIVSVTALLLAINEALGKGRGILVGVYLGMAVLSRQLTIYALPFLFMILWQNHSDLKRSVKISKLACFVAAVFFFEGVYCLMNWMRFQDPFDTGYSYIILKGFLKERVDKYGLFNIVYVPFNFIYLFLQGFHIEFKGLYYLTPHCLDPFGTSLIFASPFIFIAGWAKWDNKILFAAWFAIALMILHSLFYYSNGFYQINSQRFSLDYLPILIVLVALGSKRVDERIWKSLIVYSICLNIIATFLCSEQIFESAG